MNTALSVSIRRATKHELWRGLGGGNKRILVAGGWGIPRIFDYILAISYFSNINIIDIQLIILGLSALVLTADSQPPIRPRRSSDKWPDHVVIPFRRDGCSPNFIQRFRSAARNKADGYRRNRIT